MTTLGYSGRDAQCESVWDAEPRKAMLILIVGSACQS
jgi:hypothetical protein